MESAKPELKNLGRFLSFGERDDQRPDWSLTMRACLSVMNDDLARVFERAASSSTTITIEMLEPTRPGITTYVRQAWYLLANTFKEPVPDFELLCDTTELKLGNVSSHYSNLTLAHACQT